MKSGVSKFCGHTGGVLGERRNTGVSFEHKTSLLMESGDRREEVMLIWGEGGCLGTQLERAHFGKF